MFKGEHSTYGALEKEPPVVPIYLKPIMPFFPFSVCEEMMHVLSSFNWVRSISHSPVSPPESVLGAHVGTADKRPCNGLSGSGLPHSISFFLVLSISLQIS